MVLPVGKHGLDSNTDGRMKILFVNQCYWPDHAATAQVLVDLCEELAARGHEVAVVSSRRPYSGGEGVYEARELHNGVTIHRVAGSAWRRRTGTGGRMVDSLCYLLAALWRCLTLPTPDVIVTLTSPPQIGVVGRLLQRLKRATHIHWCMDLFPDVGVTFGVIREGGLMHRLNAWVTSRYMRSAERVLVLSRHMAQKVRTYGVDPERISIVPVWADGRKLTPVERQENRFLKTHHLEDKFVVMYSGNLAQGGDIETLLSAVIELRDEEDLAFVLISEGPRFEEFRQRCEAAGLNNTLFLPYQKREDLSHSLSAASVHIVTNKVGMEGVREPCKVYGILAAGCPFVLVGGECVATDLARDHEIGLVVREGDASGLVTAIRHIKESAEGWEQIGARARAVFEHECDALLQIDRFETLVESIVCPQERAEHGDRIPAALPSVPEDRKEATEKIEVC